MREISCVKGFMLEFFLNRREAFFLVGSFLTFAVRI
ncbi:hypothetical protein O179_02365 [Chlamydia trachomatis]|nr:hypothetical protein E150_02270 [Chlamydia trachomatis E/150]ADH18130.1 hypothetical protein G9768_02240 [Chlamydia trachomatis G/9768]ADH19053.1 hypothetical protein G11222_02245 [Chlamydia trachomatis G/11222]ADH19978.1 hypothetical protein G11074_02245 [Chlamydia trachomatis G/11074]ADH20902.1 hypothetical protein E11023_02255 [Chlamydia trachomatis E/11023]ADH97075.1 hypothetical protein CTG9301_02250 [Chlamydia trachomatis G/9301]AGJ64798.1 hypothetical protein CTLINITIAL_03595 [Chlam